MVTVLIVDDSAVVRKGLRAILVGLGYTVVAEAANGIHAFLEYSKYKPDLVTMDLTMEGMSGAEATSKIIATYPEARVVVISAIEERPIIVNALERGARHFIVKPITADKVSSVLSNVLQQKFDPKKHIEFVQKLRSSCEGQDIIGATDVNYDPPYQISVPDGKMVLVKINATFSLNSCRSLAMELDDHLQGAPRVLIDFGMTPALDSGSLRILNKIIEKVEIQRGMVRAVTRKQVFFDLVNNIEGEAIGFLAVALKFMPA